MSASDVFSCPESILGAHDARRDGTCRWCNRKVAPRMQRPRTTPTPSATDEAYTQAYDPNWGSAR